MSDLSEQVAAIVLAAGRSTRMGDFKPLLPFGGRTVIAHVVATLREAGVARIHVVTGFNAAALDAELARLGATGVRNADFDRGMFSSVRAGVASLPAEVDAFLLLPVDMPLLRAATVERILGAAASREAAIVYPTFRGERGHPPLIRRPLFKEILSGDGYGGLPPLLARYEGEAREVQVFDRGCLDDMDRPADYARLLAAVARRRFPEPAECDAMLEAAETPEPVRRHCRAVAALADDIARRLRLAGEPIDSHLARAAAWTHDIAKCRPRHAEAGAAMVTAFGFPELAEPVARHMDLRGDASRLDVSAVVYLADKLVKGERRVSLEARFAPGLARFAGDLSALAGAQRRFETARAVKQAIETFIGPVDPPDATLPGAA